MLYLLYVRLGVRTSGQLRVFLMCPAQKNLVTPTQVGPPHTPASVGPSLLQSLLARSNFPHTANCLFTSSLIPILVISHAFLPQSPPCASPHPPCAEWPSTRRFASSVRWPVTRRPSASGGSSSAPTARRLPSAWIG